MSYSDDLYRKLRAVQPVSLTREPDSFVHGTPPNQRQYTYVAFDSLQYMVQATLSYSVPQKRWDVPRDYTVLRAMRVGDVVTRHWGSKGHPNVDIFVANRWPMTKLTKLQQAHDHERFQQRSVPLPDPRGFVRYYQTQYQYAQVKGHGLYHLTTDVAGIGTQLFPAEVLTVGFELTPSRVGSARPYEFSVWIGGRPMFPTSPVSLDGDIRFLAKG